MFQKHYHSPQAAQQDLDFAVSIDHFPFAIEVFKENGNLVGKVQK